MSSELPNLDGKVYGKLLLLHRDQNDTKNYICRCAECGWEGSVRLDSAKANGATNKCNCIKRAEEGEQYGKLILIRKDPNNARNYICRCAECGWEGPVRLDNVKKYGATSNCNCVKTRNTKYDTTSLIGKQFGDLTVIGFGEYRKGKASLWKCQCKCGNIVMVAKNNLVSGNSTKCRSCADKIVAMKNRTNIVNIGDTICNNDDTERSVTIIAYDHYNEQERKHYWKWHCNFCGNEGVTSEYGLRNYKFICNKCDCIINVKRIQPKFARLTPIKLVEHNGLKWLCKCDCGNTTIVNTTDLQYGKVQSCGCIAYQTVRAETPIENYPADLHGRLQGIYRGIKGRCYDPNHSAYGKYGAKGITMCDRWLGPDGCKNFVADMGPTFQPHLTIDRIDSTKGYSPENCRWVTYKEQQNNRENNHPISYNGVDYPSVQLMIDEFIKAGKISLADKRSNSSYILNRLNNGWTIQEALMIPPESYQHTDTFRDSTISYKDEWKKEHNYIDINKLDTPVPSAIIFTDDEDSDYFEDTAKEDRRNMFFRIIPDDNK